MPEPEIVRRYLKGTGPKKPPGGDSWRDDRGRFLPGHPFIPSKVSALRRALLDEVSEKEIRKLVRRLFSRALKNDSATGNTAAKLLLDRVIGKSPLDAEEAAIQNDINNRYDPDEVFD